MIVLTVDINKSGNLALLGQAPFGTPSSGVIGAMYAAAAESSEALAVAIQEFPFKEPGSARVSQQPHFGESISVRPVASSGADVEFSVESTSPHAIILEQGAKGAFVRPVNAKALAFTQHGVTYFSKGHEVPGVQHPPRPFQSTLEKMHSQIEAIFQSHIQAALAGGGGSQFGKFGFAESGKKFYNVRNARGRFAKR